MTSVNFGRQDHGPIRDQRPACQLRFLPKASPPLTPAPPSPTLTMSPSALLAAAYEVQMRSHSLPRPLEAAWNLRLVYCRGGGARGDVR